MGIAAFFRLLRAGFVLAREGALSLVDPRLFPPSLRPAISAGRLIERPEARRSGSVERLTRALNRLGPTYVKFGQSLATRPDIVGVDVARDLAVLQDNMPPFDAALVPGILREALGERAGDLVDLSAPIAAASIAQVHRGTLVQPGGRRKAVAVKLLRPGIRRRFLDDLESYYAAAALAERLVPRTRRLRPLDVVRTLEHSAQLELDLRLEAASISEFAENIKDDTGFAIPEVSWDHTAESVLTTTWIEGIPIRDHAALEAAGLDRRELARKVLQAFLRHSIRDGYFHADMHPGNLFADPVTGDVVAVDFGIMGRISKRERRFLAEVLYGFIRRDYRGMAERHFEIGYVPASQSVDDFALALRAIGEPLHGRTARDISMAKVLGQLFTTTEVFQMQTRPELVLLQKSMVLVEGVARALDPDLDVWSIAEPVVGDWVRREAGPVGRIEELAEQMRAAGNAVARLPAVIAASEELLARELRRPESERRGVPRSLALLALWLAIACAAALLWRLLS